MRKIGALLDTNIQLSRFTHKWNYAQHTEHRMDRATSWIEEKPIPRILRGKTVEQSSSIYESLTDIAKMVKDGLVALYESDETLLEFLNFRPVGFGLGEFDVFRGITIKHARAPFARGFRIDASYTPNGARAAWQLFLSQVQHPHYLKLLKHTGGAHKADLYHVWEAEHNELDAFVTLDVTFVNAVSNPKPIKTSVNICTPSEFVRWATQLSH